MKDDPKQEAQPAQETNEAQRLTDALEGKQGEQVKWTEEFAASGNGKGGATVEP